MLTMTKCPQNRHGRDWLDTLWQIVAYAGLIGFVVFVAWLVSGCHVHLHYHAPAKHAHAASAAGPPVDPDAVLEWAIGDVAND